MEQGNAKLIALLEERLRSLKRLARAIESAQQACISADLEGLRFHDSQKQQLCAEIRRLDMEIRTLFGNIQPSGSMRAILDPAPAKGNGIDMNEARRLSDLFGESEEYRAEVERLNRVYAEFLARSRATLKVMVNVLSHCLGVYPSLGSSSAFDRPFERSY